MRLLNQHLPVDGTEVVVIADERQLERLRPAWNELRADVHSPGNQLDHVRASLQLLRKNERACVVTVWRGPRLTGVAPLVRLDGFPSRLTLAVDDVGSFLYSDEHELDLLIDAVVALGLPLDLQPLLSGAATPRHIVARTRHCARHASTRGGGPSLRLDPAWSEPAVKLSSRRRADLRRSRRRAEEFGEVAFLVDSGETVADRYDELVRVEARGWKGRSGTALVHDPRQRETLRRYVTAPEVRDSVRMVTMRIGDRIAGIDLNVIVGDRLWGMKGGVDETFKSAAPGLQLKVRSIALAVEEGLERYEFMGATAAFKEIWGEGPVDLTHLRVFPPSPNGVAALAVMLATKGRSTTQRWLERHRSPTPAARPNARVRGHAKRHRRDAAGARAARRRPGTSVPVGVPGQGRSVCIVEDLDELEALRKEWEELRADVPAPSTDLDWLKAYAQALPPGDRPHVVAIREAGRLTGVAPLIRSRRLVPRLRLLPLDVASLLYSDETQLRRLVDAMVGLREATTLEALPAGGPTDRMVSSVRAAYVRMSARLGGPSQPIDPSFADPLARLRSKKRNDLRRKRRKADARGEVTFEVYTPGDDFADRFQEFVGVEGSEWKSREGTSLAHAEVKRAMLWHYVNAPAVRDRVRIAVMRVDGRAVAADLAVLAGNRYWFHKGGFDVAYADCSPGILLKVHTIGWAAEQGLERFEFMGEPERYKQIWGAEPQRLHSLTLYPPSPAGVAAFGSDAVAKVRRVAGRYLEGVRGARGDRDDAHRVEVLADAGQLEPLRADWDELASDVPGPSSDLDWTLAYGSVLPNGDRLRLVTIFEDERLIAAAPLVLGGGPLGRLRLLDNEPCGFRFRDDDAHRRLLEAVLALRLPASLDSLPAGCPTERNLAIVAGRRRLLRSRTQLAGPSIPLDASWKEPLDKLSRNRRRDTQRRLRKAKTFGPVTFEVVAPDLDLADRWHEFVRIEACGWKRRAGTALACGTWEHDLLWRYISSPAVRDRVRFVTMRVDQVPVASEIGVLVDGRFWALKVGYDEAHASLSPGVLVGLHAMGWAASEGSSHYEQMGGAEPYKLIFGCPPREMSRIRLYPPTGRGMAVLAADVATKATRAATRWLRTVHHRRTA